MESCGLCNNTGKIDVLPSGYRPAPAANTERLRELLGKALVELRHARIFIGSRQKMVKVGQDIYDEVTGELHEALQLDAALRGEVDHTIMSKHIDHKDNLD